MLLTIAKTSAFFLSSRSPKMTSTVPDFLVSLFRLLLFHHIWSLPVFSSASLDIMVVLFVPFHSLSSTNESWIANSCLTSSTTLHIINLPVTFMCYLMSVIPDACERRTSLSLVFVCLFVLHCPVSLSLSWSFISPSHFRHHNRRNSKDLITLLVSSAHILRRPCCISTHFLNWIFGQVHRGTIL